MTTRQNKVAGSLFKGLCLLLSGLGVGWLIGLSVSEVIYAVITSLIALIVAVTGALAGVNVERDDSTENGDTNPRPRRKVRVETDPLPIMFMIIGLVIGTSLGIYARTNYWLGPRPENFTERWKITGRTDKELSGRLFDELYPPKEHAGDSEEDDSARGNGHIAPGAGASNGAIPESQPAGDGKAEGPGGESGGRDKGRSAGNKAVAESHSRKDESPNKLGAGDLAQKSLIGGLFSATDDECASFRAATDEELQNLLIHLSGSSSEAESYRQQAKGCKNAKCLRDIVEKVCRR